MGKKVASARRNVGYLLLKELGGQLGWTREPMTQDHQPIINGDIDGLEKNKIIEIHNRLINEIIPRLGLEFETEDATYDFYNSYDYRVGFSMRKSKAHNNVDGHIIDRVFCCSCECYREKDKRRTSVNNLCAQSQFECLPRMKVDCRSTEMFRIVQFIAKHKHETFSIIKTHLHRSHRKITPSLASEIDLAESSSIAPKVSCELMERRVGGRENLGFIHDNYKNYLRSKRTIQMRLGYIGGLLEYLQQMKVEDPNFFYAIQVDEDDLITNIFWRDAKMMVDYSYFGDVVCFDTTYRKNKECRPFAMFIGVDHHKLSTIFGAAKTFVWLFKSLSTAMSRKKPQTILTNQDAARAKALSLTWPKTSHHLCIWHLYLNALKNLSVVFGEFQDFQQELQQVHI
ncbi:hypothetical protein Lal_00026970 [Lupinus albus]|nr:hypothetical protein Lal_00026970 [Lupinus albus]